jgi:hypothetical protein
MSEQIMGKVEVQDGASNIVISLNALNGDIAAGGFGKDGDLNLLDNAGVGRVKIDGNRGDIDLGPPGAVFVSLSGFGGRIRAGGKGSDGHLVLEDDKGRSTIHLDAGGIDPNTHLPRPPISGQVIGLSGTTGRINAGGNNKYGQLNLLDAANSITVQLDASGGGILVGGNGMDGEIRLFRESSNQVVATATVLLEGASGKLNLGGSGVDGSILIKGANGQQRIQLDGKGGNLWLGGNGADGDVVIFSKAVGNTSDTSLASIHLDGEGRRISLKGPNKQERIRLDASEADLVVKDADGNNVFHFEGQNNQLSIGALAGKAGNLVVRDGNLRASLSFSGNSPQLVIGSQGHAGSIQILDDGNNGTITLDGDSGDIILENADCAEEFDVSEGEEIQAGSVMVFDRGGKLRPGHEAYDKRVAGVISGAGDCKPGILLDRKKTPSHRSPIALVGKVYCKVDAQYAPIEVGDLLTTSTTLGHAMKADDPLRAFGAVIGKALHPLKEGTGLIPIIVALQ